MRSVKSLSESVRSSVRSGVVLFDIARVVEELIFNCLDARASKVSVFVGIETCYVKVVDDGIGITRDGLELVGERYATSKFDHLIDKNDSETGSFGFRGEALASISDVSLLEIVTKARGRPNGYRKVMKGSKCLYLGICDDIKEVGTTVVTRDLFYNQPVRRKYIKCSPKKALQSIKKCVLRISLVHSKVSFKVVDIDSDEILLCTQASSPMSVLTSYFGIDISSSLHKLDVGDDDLRISGYISGPSDNLSIKVERFMLNGNLTELPAAFQYVYINSRFVSKGPVNKLVNQMASRFDCNDVGKTSNGTRNRKRSRPQTQPSFILNINCPRSFYDLTFEPSKTYVEFKDWVPVLTLLDEAIQDLWMQNTSHGTDVMGKDQLLCGDENAKFDLEDKNFQGSSILGKTKHSIRNHHALPDHTCSGLKIPIKEDDHWFHEKWDRTPIQCSNLPEYFNEQENVWDFNSQSNRTGDDCSSKCAPEAYGNSKDEMLSSDNKFLFINDCFSGYKANCGERCRDSNEHGFSFGPQNGKDFSKIESNNVEMFGDAKKAFLTSCSLRGNLSQGSSLFKDYAYDFQSDESKIDKILTNLYDESEKRSFDFLKRVAWQDRTVNFECFPTYESKYCSVSELESFPGAFGLQVPFCDELFVGNDGFSAVSVSEVEMLDNDRHKLNSDLQSLMSDSNSYFKVRDEEQHDYIDRLEDRIDYVKRASDKHFMNNEDNNDRRYGYTTYGKRSSCSNSGSEDSGSLHSHRTRSLNKELSPKRAFRLSDETDWLNLYSHIKRHKRSPMYKTQRQIRSHSAPPFCRKKRRFFTLHCHSTEEPAKALPCPEACEHLKSVRARDSLLDHRPDLNKARDIKEAEKNTNKDKRFKQTSCTVQAADPLKETASEEIQDSSNYWTKWRQGCSKIMHNNDKHDQNNVLDVSSGFLHLAGDSLVPESISKACLEGAIVLQQVDKKFIPVVAGKTLALVDQHAADERIRLEELRQKVLFGEAKTITFLEAEQELKLPEIGHQLLHNYAREIEEWGWICNFHSQDSKSFKRSLNLLHRQSTPITLKAVPCILGVTLSDADLMEFLQQLADTDGSSMIPPSVLRLLNSKACRGAIMFGDSLLPSECSLLISELKQTSLCFQCAHGRPTTAPLVDLVALHKQIAKIALRNDDANRLWHGLRRHELSLERAEQRLSRTS